MVECEGDFSFDNSGGSISQDIQNIGEDEVILCEEGGRGGNVLQHIFINTDFLNTNILYFNMNFLT